MRKHDVRKWLHAILDLLPVILIPVFMIYSHRHEINNGSIQVQEKQVVDFNQLVFNGDFSNNSNWDSSNLNYGSINIQNNICTWTCTTAITQYYQSGIIQHDSLFDIPYNHKVIVSGDILSSTTNTVAIYGMVGGTHSYAYRDNVTANTWTNICGYLSDRNVDVYVNRAKVCYSSSSVIVENDTLSVKNLMFFDVTQMFGVGNEPTIIDFKSTFTDIYYEYTQSKKMLINGDLVTYNDTDIMSQMTYQLYNSVDKYFNMGNVFNMNGIYDWFNLNIFNGQAPIYIYIVWQIVLYEFVMDLLFLLYGLFMWFIDMVEKMMDRPFKSIK